MLELTVLHVLDEWQIELGHVVLVHVEQDVADHHNALFDFFPDSIELAQKLLVMVQLDVFGNRLEQVNGCLLYSVVEHLAMLVEHETVGRAVQLLIGETRCLLVVNFEDGVLNGVPVLLGLRALHVRIAHLVTVHVELVLWQIRHLVSLIGGSDLITFVSVKWKVDNQEWSLGWDANNILFVKNNYCS